MIAQSVSHLWAGQAFTINGMNSLRGISSMATKALLADLAACYTQATGRPVEITSMGGVDAAKRVEAGEPYDLVILASDALQTLAERGWVQADSIRAIVDSEVAVAVPEAPTAPSALTADIASVAGLQAAVRAARRIGYSTGPSGKALVQLFKHWGMADELRPKLVQASPGVPVGQLVAEGQVDIGFQQSSELQGLRGIRLLGKLPGAVRITTTFAAGVAARAVDADSAWAFITYMTEAQHHALKQQHGMTAPLMPARASQDR
jgi:molybdate transport system substrate-binding protein